MEKEFELQGKVYLCEDVINVGRPKDEQNVQGEQDVKLMPPKVEIKYTPQEEKFIKDLEEYCDNELHFISNQLFNDVMAQAKQTYNNIITKEVEECMEQLINDLTYDLLFSNTYNKEVQQLTDLWDGTALGEQGAIKVINNYKKIAQPIIDDILMNYQMIKIVFEKQPNPINEDTIGYIIDMLIQTSTTVTCNLHDIEFKEYYDEIKEMYKQIGFIQDNAKLRSIAK